MAPKRTRAASASAGGAHAKAAMHATQSANNASLASPKSRLGLCDSPRSNAKRSATWPARTTLASASNAEAVSAASTERQPERSGAPLSVPPPQASRTAAVTASSRAAAPRARRAMAANGRKISFCSASEPAPAPGAGLPASAAPPGPDRGASASSASRRQSRRLASALSESTARSATASSGLHPAFMQSPAIAPHTRPQTNLALALAA